MKIDTTRFEASLEENKQTYYHLLVTKARLEIESKLDLENEIPQIKYSDEVLANANVFAMNDRKLLLQEWMWEGLGYYNRARNLKVAAQQVMEEYNGVFPDTFEEIKKLKGIGSYTAGAISSFVYHQQKPAVDGNVFRVVTRLLEDSDDIMKASTRTKIERMLEQVIPAEAPGDFNQGLIELGAIVCLPNGEPKV